MLMSLTTVTILMNLPTAVQSRHNPYETPEYLRKTQRDALLKATKVERNFGVAKNLVLAIGDGMGVPTLTAGRIYKGQKKGLTGEECKLSFEEFPAVGLSKTYNLDRQVPDSAGTAVAMMSGIKVNFGTLGVDGRVPNGDDCSKICEATKVKTLLDHALEAGKSVGLVTTARVTHATPAAAYSHVPNRDYECDVDMTKTVGCGHVKDIARQLIEDNPNINVIMGGGRRCFLNKTSSEDRNNKRQDGRDLIAHWTHDKETRGLAHKYVSTREELLHMDPATTDYVLGLFSADHLDYELERKDGQPSLEEMTRKAIQVLQKNPKGFFLMVEGGRIDHAHHVNLAHLALGETDKFSDTVQTVVDMTSELDTLVTVTADHSHVFMMSGYPSRGNDIFGKVDPPAWWNYAEDNLPFLTLGYRDGPSGRVNGPRTNLTDVDTSALRFEQPADVKISYETHGGEDVAIFSKGPWSHLFHTTHEQSYIAHVLMYAACIGDYRATGLCHKEGRMWRKEEKIPFKRDVSSSRAKREVSSSGAKTGNKPEVPSSAHSTHTVHTLTSFGLTTVVALGVKLWVKQLA